MAHKLVYSRTALRDIHKLDSVTKIRIKKRLELYVIDPKTYAKRLTNSTLGTYRWRIGNYRVVFDIDGKNVVVLRIGHRGEIYKRK